MTNYGKYDFSGKPDFKDDKVFEFDEENLFKVLDTMKDASELLKTIPTDEIVEKYVKMFPPTDGVYLMSESILDRVNSEFLAETLMSLVNQNLVDMSWSDEQNDFIFTLKDASSL